MDKVVPMDYKEAKQASDYIVGKAFVYNSGPSQLNVLAKDGRVKSGFTSAQLNPKHLFFLDCKKEPELEQHEEMKLEQHVEISEEQIQQ